MNYKQQGNEIVANMKTIGGIKRLYINYTRK